jgi:uncharacterized protein YutE (UPF0331/DUF86 family)
MNVPLDDVLALKVASLRRCVARAREERALAGTGFREDFSHQDASLLNIFRACEQGIDLGNHLVRKLRLGVPAHASDSFALLQRASVIPADLCAALVRMTAFRNTAIHEYRRLDLDVVERVLAEGLDDLLAFAELALNRPA